MAFKMRSGNSPLEFKQVGSSPVKQHPSTKEGWQTTYDASETDERVYDIDQNKYDEWRNKNTNAPDIRYLGSRENKAWLEKYLASKTTPPETPTEEPETEVPETEGP